MSSLSIMLFLQKLAHDDSNRENKIPEAVRKGLLNSATSFGPFYLEEHLCFPLLRPSVVFSSSLAALPSSFPSSPVVPQSSARQGQNFFSRNLSLVKKLFLT